MKVKEVKVKMLSAIQDAMANHGFIYDKKENAYIRSILEGTQKFYFLMPEGPDGVYIEPRWSIQLKDILDIYNQVTEKEAEFIGYTSVLENSLGQLIEYVDENNERGSGKRMRYLVEDENDIKILKDVIPLRFEQYVLPYFK